MKQLRTQILIAIFALALSSPASATLLGLNVDIAGPNSSCLGILVDCGVECRIEDGAALNDDDYVDVNVGESSITFDFFERVAMERALAGSV